MTPEQQIIAGDFVDELIILGVLSPKTEADKVVANAPPCSACRRQASQDNGES